MGISNLNFNNVIRKESERIKDTNTMLGVGLLQPNNATNSSSRKLMFNQHVAQSIAVVGAQRPLVSTGFENEYGKRSSSYVVAAYDYDVIAKIPKFSEKPDHHYYLITYCAEKNELGVIESKSYQHTTESYGYEFDTSLLDRLNVGNSISRGSVIRRSMSFDEYNNRMDGTNLLCAYISMDRTMEDSIVISESAAKKLASSLFKPVEIIINDNDIPLNIHGNDMMYKAIPDIGDEIRDGLVCAVRREKKDESLYMQSKTMLRTVMASDDSYTVNGKVIDINIRCNNPDALLTEYNEQLNKYYNESIRVAKNVMSAVDAFLEAGIDTKMDQDLEKLYVNSKRILNGTQFSKEGKVFSNVIIEIFVQEENLMSVGDKLSNRYGGKGCAAIIMPDYEMPQADNGEYVECILNKSGVVGRNNSGQSFEQSLTHIGQRTIDLIGTGVLSVDESIEAVLEYLYRVSPEQGDYYGRIIDDLTDEEKQHFLDSIIGDNGICVALKPMSETMDIFKLAEMYDEFPYAVQGRAKVPMRNCRGQVRLVDTSRPMVIGRNYVYRLKQYAEEKFSATSLSSTNIRNENSRSRASKNYKAPHTRTPIRFGEMESGDLNHLGPEYVVFNLMLYSTSPHARRLADELYTGDPYNIDIKLDEYAKSRNAEIANTYLKTMGLRLIFEKVKREYIQPITKKPITFIHNENSPRLEKPIWFRPMDEPLSPDYYDLMFEREKMVQPITKIPVTFLTEDHKGPDYPFDDED